MKSNKNWVLVAAQGGAKIYSVSNREKDLHLLEQVDNQEGRLKKGEIVSDHSGSAAHSRFSGSAHFDKLESAKDHLNQVFAQRIMHKLDQARKENLFQKLIIVADPGFGPFLKHSMGAELEKTIFEFIPKNYLSLSISELGQNLKERIVASLGDQSR